MFLTPNPAHRELDGGRLSQLLEPVVYLDSVGIDEDRKEVRIDVPTGFITDFASVPRLFWNILPPTGTYSRAAIVHDYLYVTGKAGGQRISRGYADRILRQAMQELGVGWWTRWTMFSAVRAGAGGCWDKRRKADKVEAV